MNLIFVINGEDQAIEIEGVATLGQAVDMALTEARNLARPAADWEIRSSEGVLLEAGRPVQDFRFEPGARLFMNVRAGAGGDGTEGFGAIGKATADTIIERIQSVGFSAPPSQWKP